MKNLIKCILVIALLITTPLYAVKEVDLENKITSLYISFFNRAADTAGLTYWSDKGEALVESGEGIALDTLKELSAGFATHPVFTNTYNSMSDEDFVNAIYNNALGRDGDTAGINYWVGLLSSGKSRSDMVAEFMEISLTADLENDPQYEGLSEEDKVAAQERQDLISNKVTVALYFTRNLGTRTNLSPSTDAMDPSSLATDASYLASQIVIADVELENDTVDTAIGKIFLLLLYDNAIAIINDQWSSLNYSIPSAVISEDNLSTTVEETVISFSEYDIDEEDKLHVGSTEKEVFYFDDDPEEEVHVKSYSFELQGKSEFDSLVEIILEYDDSFIETSADESQSVIAMYYNPNTQEFELVDYQVDTLTNTVTILTDHLSTFSVFTVKNENKRFAKISRINSYKLPISSTDAASIIQQTLDNNMASGDLGYEAGFSIANEWLGIAAAANTLGDAGYPTELVSSLGDAFNRIGVGAAILQAAIDFNNGDQTALYSNLLKNGAYNTVNFIGTSALQLSFVGVFAIDYSLSSFANEAWDGRKEIYYEAYKLYYAQNRRKAPEWYKIFYNLYLESQKDNNPEILKQKIYDEIRSYANEFWNDPDKVAEYWSDVKETGFTFGGGYSEALAQEITDAKIAELVPALQPVFNKLNEKIQYNLREEYRQSLIDLKTELNEEIKVTIKGAPNPMYANYTVKFEPLSHNANDSSWTGTLDEYGSANTKFTILGHMQAGSPSMLQVKNSSGTVVQTINFEITLPELIINMPGCNDNEEFQDGECKSKNNDASDGSTALWDNYPYSEYCEKFGGSAVGGLYYDFDGNLLRGQPGRGDADFESGNYIACDNNYYGSFYTYLADESIYKNNKLDGWQKGYGPDGFVSATYYKDGVEITTVYSENE